MSTFHAITFYGYRITIPSDVNIRNYVEDLYTLNSMIQSQFEICGIISDISSDVDYSEYDDYENINFILGFRPSNDVCLVQSNGLTLEEYIHNEPILDGIEFSGTPAFYAGIEWSIPDSDTDAEESDSDSDDADSDESDDDDDSDDEEDSDEEIPCDSMSH